MRHMSSRKGSCKYSTKTHNITFSVRIFVTDVRVNNSILRNEAEPAVHTTHGRVAQGAQAIHSLWNLRLAEVTHRTIKTEVETCCFTNYFPLLSNYLV